MSRGIEEIMDFQCFVDYMSFDKDNDGSRNGSQGGPFDATPHDFGNGLITNTIFYRTF